MMPGFGETAGKQYQRQVHDSFVPSLREDFEKFVNMCGEITDVPTDQDIQWLWDMANTLDWDGEAGLVDIVKEFAGKPEGLQDRLNFKMAKGSIKGYGLYIWKEEKKPESGVNQAIVEALSDVRKHSMQDWVREHPEYLKQFTSETDEEVEKLAIRVKSMEEDVDELRNTKEELETQVKDLTDRNETLLKEKEDRERSQRETPEVDTTKREEPATGTPERKHPATQRLLPQGLLHFEKNRYWKYVLREDEAKNEDVMDTSLNILDVPGLPSFVPLTVLVTDTDRGRDLASIEYSVHFLNMEVFERFMHRTNDILTEYIQSGRVHRGLPVKRSFDESLLFYPETIKGEIRPIQNGRIDFRHFRDEGQLYIRAGRSEIRFGIQLDNNKDLPRFIEDVTALLELIMSTSEEISEAVT